MRYKVTELFSSCGGMSKGFENAGFEIKVANEIWEPAARTYVRNHSKTKMILGDITKPEIKEEVISLSKENSVDVIIGGPPCQAYSVAGLRKPNDPRGKLFEDYITVVEEVQPKIFVMENVRGLLSIWTEKENLSEEEMKEINKFNELKEKKVELILKRRKSKTSPNVKFTKEDEKEISRLDEEIKNQHKIVLPFQEKLIEKIKRKFHSIGYKVDYKVLNAANYGVPQLRERVIIIGTRYDIPIKFPKETFTKENWITVREAIDDLKDIDEDVKINHLIMNHSKEFLKKIKSIKCGKSLFGVYSHAFNKPNPDHPSKTVKENHGSVFLHYEKNRAMTPRELARLQSFPDDFFFDGAKNQVLVQIGNAVPPRLAEAVGKSIKSMLRTIKNLENPILFEYTNIYKTHLPEKKYITMRAR